MPTQQQTFDGSPSPISQAVQIWGEGPEIVPYAEGFIPPTAFLPGLNGGSGSVNGSGSDTGSSSQVAQSYDLHWVAGDTADFQFYFDGVCWVDTEPADTLGLTWVDTVWESQVRMAQALYYGYWWPPVWPGYRYLFSFTVTAAFQADFNGLGPGTMVTLTGGTIWPGDFVWDLQTKQWANPTDTATYTTRTWLSGKVVVDPQVTQQDIWPPSNWYVYPMAWE
jgi:hypothetical protein